MFGYQYDLALALLRPSSVFIRCQRGQLRVNSFEWRAFSELVEIMKSMFCDLGS